MTLRVGLSHNKHTSRDGMNEKVMDGVYGAVGDSIVLKGHEEYLKLVYVVVMQAIL